MVLEVGLALVLALLWTDGCRRHVWESLGPLHAFSCDCRGFRYYCRHDSNGRCFTFSHSPPPSQLRVSDRSSLDALIVELAGPSAPLSFVAAQLGDTAHCTRPLVSAASPGDHVHQEVRIPIINENARHLQLFLYGKCRPHAERLLAVAKLPVELPMIVGIHDVAIPFLNSDSQPAGHVRLFLRVSPPGSPSPWGPAGMPGGVEPILVLSAGGRPAIAIPEDEPKGVDCGDVEANSDTETLKEKVEDMNMAPAALVAGPSLSAQIV